MENGFCWSGSERAAWAKSIAHQINLKRDVAIKIISQEMIELIGEDPEELAVALRRFQREVETMAQVRHPNVLQIFDYGTARVSRGGKTAAMEYIAVEYVPGNTLRYTMSEEGFENEDALTREWLRHYFLPVLDGMAAVHAQGIVHRDIKPENVLMDGDIPKLADFGLARSVRLQAVSNSWDVKGTTAYMAPEQFSDFRRAGVSADIYALGKILYEAMAGRMDARTVPFKPAALSSAETPLACALDTIVRTATAERPEERYAGIASFRDAVIRALDTAKAAPGARAVPAGTVSQRVTAHHRNRLLWVFMGLTLLFLAGMTAWHLTRYFRPASPTSPPSLSSVRSATAPTATPSQGPVAKEVRGHDGLPMIYVRGTGTDAFYMDRQKVTYHQFVEFLNAMSRRLTVTDGIVRDGSEIWAYTDDGSQNTDPVVYEFGQFHLRQIDAAARPVTRVTWLGARAYARYHGKRLPSVSEWQAAARLLDKALADNGIAMPERVPPSELVQHHAEMMGDASVTATSGTPDMAKLPFQDLGMHIREWVRRDKVSDAGSPGKRDTDPIASRVIRYVSGKTPRTVLRYPWEGFTDVGFRTTMPAPNDASDG